MPHVKLVYIGSTGGKGGTIRSRLKDHATKTGWGTAFRRKVLEHVLCVPEGRRGNPVYAKTMRAAAHKLSQVIREQFAFRCLATDKFDDFEKWLVQKYKDRLWNKSQFESAILDENYDPLEQKLDSGALVRFSQFETAALPDQPGVYKIFHLGEVEQDINLRTRP